jgi:hypothetical protein
MKVGGKGFKVEVEDYDPKSGSYVEEVAKTIKRK